MEEPLGGFLGPGRPRSGGGGKTWSRGTEPCSECTEKPREGSKQTLFGAARYRLPEEGLVVSMPPLVARGDEVPGAGERVKVWQPSLVTVTDAQEPPAVLVPLEEEVAGEGDRGSSLVTDPLPTEATPCSVPLPAQTAPSLPLNRSRSCQSDPALDI